MVMKMLNEKQKKEFERKRLISKFFKDRQKSQEADEISRVHICPRCGQPTCTENIAEKYFKRSEKDDT